MSEETIKYTFSNNLCFYLEKNNVKPIDIAKVCNVTKAAVSNWVNGKKMPRMDKIEILANYFDISKSELIERHTQKTGLADTSQFPSVPAPSEVDPDALAIKMYKNLDPDDKAEIRGEMKQMLKADKYSEKGELFGA